MMRILYVEDNMANVSLVRRIAKNDEVINYIDGTEALANFENDDPDLVLLDIQLAGPLNGLEVVKKLRERGVTLPVIAVTAYAMVGDRERCLAAGCDDYISKPLPIPQLVTLFEKRREQIAITSQPETTEKTDEPSRSVKSTSAPLGTTTERLPIPSKYQTPPASQDESNVTEKTVKSDEADAARAEASTDQPSAPADQQTPPASQDKSNVTEKTVKSDEADAARAEASTDQSSAPADQQTPPASQDKSNVTEKTVKSDEADAAREEASSQK